MNLRGHRGIAALLMLLALVLSAMALLPARAQASSQQVTGLVSQCGSGTTFIAGAKVTLSDANGIQPSLSTTTDGAGVYTFTPPAATYTISVSKVGYYSNNTPLSPQVSPFRFDGSATVTVNVCLDAQPGTTGTVTFTVVNAANTNQKIGGAQLSIYNPARLPSPYSAIVYSNTTNVTTGQALASLWSGSFEVRVNANGFNLFIQTMAITPPASIQIGLTAGVAIVGHARNEAGQFISKGLTGWLYNLSALKYAGAKVIPASVSGSLFNFSAPAGTYRMVVDADGYAAYDQVVTIPGPNPHDVTLPTSAQEQDRITVAFGAKDWSNFTVSRNLTLNADSVLAGLMPSGLRDLRQQINFTLGDGTGNGTNGATGAAFQTWLLKNGPLYVATDAFLLLNGKSYASNATSFQVSVSGTLSTPADRVWINSSATYKVKSSAWIAYGGPKYFLNMTVLPDTNVSVYHNVTYLVVLPSAYEMVSDTILPNPSAIATYNYTRITVDPGLTGQAIRMVIQKAASGTARAKVTGPSGKFHVANSTYSNYQAFVANNENITFSAAETTNPPSNDSTRDNYTWQFLSNGSIPNPPNNLKYGIQPTFRFPLAGPYRVFLKAVGSGGNVSYRNITIWSDGSAPTPDFKTNITGSGSAIGAHLHVNQGTAIRFDGGLSTDQAYTGKPGIILNTGYAWDFNGDRITDATGRVANYTFGKPGNFTVNLTVTDSVGNKASNVSLSILVNDTQAPVPGFTILDPSNDYAPVSTLVEGRNYTLNASKTTDNYDKLSALNFTWTIPGPIVGLNGTTHPPFYGLNITLAWSEWNLSYPVKLVVRDTGFGSGKPNNGTLTQNVSVQIYHPWHPYLTIVTGSVKISNANPESGTTITVTLNVTNQPGWGTASQIYVLVKESSTGPATGLSPSWSITDKNGTAVSTIASGTTVVFKISFAVTGQGNKTLTITVSDHKMPFTLSGNTVTESIVVNQPAWVNYAIIGSVVAVFAVVIFAMYYRRKVKAGDWQPRFRRGRGGKDEGGREKPKKEKEVKEEKKRL